MTPEGIVARIAEMTDPDRSTEPFDSEQTLAHLIQESRRALGRRLTRQRARMYDYEAAAFMSAMVRIERAPAEDVREFARDVVDLLWGVGSAVSRRDPRRLEFDNEWEGDAIEEVARYLLRHGISPW